ncbi:MAG: endonuclease/exonuclease/phosphatase family protein [Candidatus Cloacimonadaceae bacterium]|nr:endonuclease/exonuclease/phosphatase family protein [Candidatus Cloacimonadaceae bacterium]
MIKIPRITYIIWLLAMMMVLCSCGTNTKIINPETPPSLAFGTDATFDVATWNLRTFPVNGNTTLDHLARLIPLLKLELIAFQEINSHSAMIQLDERLADYSSYISEATSSYRLAYLYDNRSITVHDAYPIMMGMQNPFPRPPYVIHLTWRDEEIYVINNHLKAYGDNIIDETDEWDEERRRIMANQLLDQYIVTNLPNDKVIVLGDFNDEIQEGPESNVFMAFINKPDEYYFTTMPIAQNITYSNASYPTWPSHIDHILITNELFDAFEASGRYCRTIIIENAMGTWQNYYANVSDHRPVGLRLKFD